jgi:hypothetical protein
MSTRRSSGGSSGSREKAPLPVEDLDEGAYVPCCDKVWGERGRVFFAPRASLPPPRFQPSFSC